MTDDEDAPRRYPSTIGGAFYLGVLAVALGGVLIVAFGGSWRVGIRVLAGALAQAGVLSTAVDGWTAGRGSTYAFALSGVALVVTAITAPQGLTGLVRRRATRQEATT